MQDNCGHLQFYKTTMKFPDTGCTHNQIKSDPVTNLRIQCITLKTTRKLKTKAIQIPQENKTQPRT